jgi:hypothetical protein
MTAPQDPFGYGTPTGPRAGSPWGPPPRAGYPPAPPGSWSGAPRTETKAMIALGLAIAAYTPTIPFVGAIAALVLARMARRDIAASGGRLTGLSLCTWAVVLSWLHLALVGLLFLGFIAIFLLPFSLL